jgi:hypothetical protein
LPRNRSQLQKTDGEVKYPSFYIDIAPWGRFQAIMVFVADLFGGYSVVFESATFLENKSGGSAVIFI